MSTDETATGEDATDDELTVCDDCYAVVFERCRLAHLVWHDQLIEQVQRMIEEAS